MGQATVALPGDLGETQHLDAPAWPGWRPVHSLLEHFPREYQLGGPGEQEHPGQQSLNDPERDIQHFHLG